MNGREHKIFSPVFSCCATALLCSTGAVPVVAESPQVTTIVVGALSLMTTLLPDSDLIALKPRPIILGTAKKRKSNKYGGKTYYYVIVSKKVFDRDYSSKKNNNDFKYEQASNGYYIYYTRSGTRNKLMMITALFLKSIGLKRHRGFHSHSPVLWVPLLMALLWLLYSIPACGIYLGTVGLGFSMGIWSHLIGDLMTKDGLPLLGDDMRIQPMKYIPFARSSNTWWVYVCCFIIINIFTFLMFKDIFFVFWGYIGELFKGLWTAIKSVFGFLEGLL